MPFAGDAGRIARLPECLCKGRFSLIERNIAVSCYTVGAAVSPGQASSSTGRTDGQCDEGIGKPGATLIGDSVEVWRPNPFVAGGAVAVPAVIVGQNKDDIWSGCILKTIGGRASQCCRFGLVSFRRARQRCEDKVAGDGEYPSMPRLCLPNPRIFCVI